MKCSFIARLARESATIVLFLQTIRMSTSDSGRWSPLALEPKRMTVFPELASWAAWAAAIPTGSGLWMV